MSQKSEYVTVGARVKMRGVSFHLDEIKGHNAFTNRKGTITRNWDNGFYEVSLDDGGKVHAAHPSEMELI